MVKAPSAAIKILPSLMTSLATPAMTNYVSNFVGQQLGEESLLISAPVSEDTPKCKYSSDAYLMKTTVVPEMVEESLARAEVSQGASGIQALTVRAIQAANDFATKIRNERMRQAHITFNAALILTVLGILIIFSGVALFLFSNAITTGTITTTVGAVTEVVSAILFSLNHDTNDRLDIIGRDLTAIETARIAMSLIDQIGDSHKRDDAIIGLAKDLRSRGQQAQGKDR